MRTTILLAVFLAIIATGFAAATLCTRTMHSKEYIIQAEENMPYDAIKDRISINSYNPKKTYFMNYKIYRVVKPGIFKCTVSSDTVEFGLFERGPK